MLKFLISIGLVFSFGYSYTMNFTKDTRGLVRQTKVYKYPAWVSKIELNNGKEVFFCSPKSMFEFYFRPGRWHELGVKDEYTFKDIIVTDFKTLEPVNAKGAFYVYGSNITSPAGDDLVAFDSYKAAQEFAKKHNGKRVLGFREVSDALIRLLNGRI